MTSNRRNYLLALDYFFQLVKMHTILYWYSLSYSFTSFLALNVESLLFCHLDLSCRRRVLRRMSCISCQLFILAVHSLIHRQGENHMVFRLWRIGWSRLHYKCMDSINTLSAAKQQYLINKWTICLFISLTAKFI